MNNTSQLLTTEVLKNLFWRGESLLGPAVFAAKCSVITWYPTNDYLYGPAVLWTLLGDPALRVRHGISSAVESGEERQVTMAGTLVRPGLARASAMVSYTLSAPASVRLELFREDGTRVGVLDAGYRCAGAHSVTVHPGLAAGVYFVWLSVGQDGQATARRFTSKLTLLP